MTLSKSLDRMPRERRLYTLATLAQHLFDAGQSARLALLFQDDGWMKARFAGSDSTYTGFLSDLELAWQKLPAVESAWQSDGGLIRSFVQHVRYGLLTSSVISLASNIPPELVLRQVETGEWSTQRAMSYIMQMETLPEQRAIAYALLLKSGRLSLTQQKEAVRQGLGAAAAIAHELDRAQALIELAPSLTGDVLTQALDLILEVQNDEWRAMTLLALSPQLTDPHLLDRALEVAWALPPTRKRSLFAAPRVIHGTRAEVAQERERALSSLIRTALWWPSVLNFSEQGLRALVVSGLAPQLDALQLAEALGRVRRIKDVASRAQTLAALAPLLAHDARNAILADMLDLAQDRSLLWLLAKSLPYFKAADRQQVWVLIREFIQELGAPQGPEPDIDRGTSFETGPLSVQPARLDDLSQKGSLQESLDLIQPRYPDLVQALAILAPQLGMAHEEAVARSVEDLFDWQAGWLLVPAEPLAPAEEWEKDLARLLIALARHLCAGEQEMSKARAQGVARTIRHPWYRERVLLALSSEQHDRSLATSTILKEIEAIRRQDQRIPALQALGPYLEGALLEQSVELALAIEQVGPRLDTLDRLAAQLRGPLLQRAVEAAHGIEDEAARVELFSSLLPGLEPEQAEDIAGRALDAVGAVPAVDQARENSPRAQVLMALAPNLLEPQRKEIMDQALQAVQQLKRGYGDNPRLEALAVLAPLLSHEQRWPVLKRELDVVYDAEEPILRAKADALLFPYLNQDRYAIEKRDYALDTALHGSSPYNAQMLMNLIPHLTEAQRVQVMDELPLWFSADDRATILAALARHWPEADQSSVLECALKAIQEAESAAVKVVGLKILAPRLEGELLESAWQTSCTILDRASRASAMAALAPCWAAAERAKKLDEALALLQTLADDESHAQVLGQLAKNQVTWVRGRRALLQPLLISLIRGAARGKRHMFLHRLLDLEPVWLTLTPPGTAWQVIQTVVEVSGQWRWP